LPKLASTVSDHPADQVKGYPCRFIPVSLLVGSGHAYADVYCPAARNVAIWISQAAAALSGAVALYEPIADVVRSSAMSPSGDVMIRLAYAKQAEFRPQLAPAQQSLDAA
jgi:hypothetical protein